MNKQSLKIFIDYEGQRKQLIEFYHKGVEIRTF